MGPRSRTALELQGRERVNKTPVEFWVLIEDSLYSLNLDQKNYLKESDDEFAESRCIHHCSAAGELKVVFFATTFENC